MDKSLQVIAMYLLTHIGLIFFLYPTDIIESVSVGHWSAILLGFVTHAALLVVYTKGLSYFAPHNLIDIFRGVGKVFAALMLVPITIYLVMIMIITVRAYAEIITIVFISNTPLWSIMFLILAVSTFVTILGVESLFRTGLLVTFLFLPILLFVFFVSFQNTDWHYALPLMDRHTASFSYVFHRPYLLSLFAFAGGFTFLGFIPSHVSYKRSKVIWSSLLLLPLFLISVYIPILTFGENTSKRFLFPFIMAVDTVDISWLMFDRVTIFFMISLISFILLFLSLAMWKTILLFRRALPSVRPIPAYAVLALFIFLVCLSIPDWNSVERLLWWNTLLRLYVAIVIPVVTFLLGLRQQRRGAAP